MADVTKGETVLEIKGLTTGYAGVPVVRDINIVVGAGEVVSLLGPNGAGKTTTLITVSGLLPAFAGSVELLGEPVDSSSAFRNARRGLAHVAEDRSLFFDLTVAENLRLGLTGAKANRQHGLDLAVEFFPALGDLMSRSAGLLSGGEQQMLAVARALVSQPKMLFIDEMSLGWHRSSWNGCCPPCVISPTEPAVGSWLSSSTSIWPSASPIAPT